MSVTTFNTTYFDDLSVKDLNQKTPLDKNYLRILFKPGYSVQVRELNQLQSILQNQIDQFGSSIYRDGAAIHGGNVSFDTTIKVVDIQLNENYVESRLSNISYLKDSRGLVASVYSYEILEVEGATSTIVRFYVRYTNSVQDSNGENIQVFQTQYLVGDQNVVNVVLEYDIDFDTTDLTVGAVSATSYCAGAFLSEGIFYTKGHFAHTPKQQFFFATSEFEVDVKSQINGYIYLNNVESVVNYSQDDTLLDNANGTPNYSAPGADRYTIDLTLGFATEEDFSGIRNSIKLLTIKNSLVIDAIKDKYSDLDRTFARRTFEESGNYTVNPFAITVREFYNDGSNGGRYQFEEIPSDTYLETDNPEEIVDKANDLYSLSLDPGIAYVSGYRIETGEKQEKYVSKARGASHISPTINLAVSAGIGNYVIGEFNPYGSILPAVQNTTTEYNLIGESEPIGTCRIRAVEPANDDRYALFLYDVVLEDGENFSSVLSIETITEDPNPDFVFLLDAPVLYSATQNSALFPIPHSTVQNVSELEYYVLRTVTSISTTYTLSQTDETFADASNTIVQLDDDTITTANPTLSLDAKTITFSSNVVSAVLKIKIKTTIGSSRIKTKAKEEQEDVITPIDGVCTLTKSDLIRLIEVRVGNSSGPIVTEYCTITTNGQYSAYYSNAVITYSGPSLGDDDLWIQYEYLDHEDGDYFTVNSYSSLDYSEIPSFNDIRLSDVLDFRPLILADSGPLNAAMIDPNSVFEADINYYLPRIDNVIVTPSGEFIISQGQPALDPSAPSVPRNSMLLYTLNIPAYTFSTSDIKITTIDNRRYTMRDIGKISDRINKLEYYTALSLLERNAIDRRIVDTESSIDRFKNGILVDSFYNHAIGDVRNVGYLCAVDTVQGGLSPKQLAKSIPLKTFSSQNLREHAHSLTLNYNEVELITQLSASETLSVNPYDVAVFTGSVSLLPSTDDWKDTISRPDIIVNDTGAFDAMQIASRQVPNMFGTVNGEWSINWASVNIRGTIVQRPTNFASRIVTTTTLGSTVTSTSLGERVVDTSYIPYIRSRKIYFTGTGLKPLTRVYAYFDNIDVTEYCNQINHVPALNFDKIDDSSVELFTGITSSNTTIFKGLPLITDESGKVYGEFIIPNNTIHKFKTGDRTLKLTSSPRNIISEEETFATGVYTAVGTTLTTQETILSIKKPVVNTTQTVQTRRWRDPVAQTFIIPEIEEGVYVTSADIYFSAKSSTLPVQLEIVTVENGIPTQNTVPFSSVSLDPAAVSIDPISGNSPTNFAFSDPVYLKPGVEYAIVLLSNDSAYRIWVAKVGGTDVSTQSFISKNVYGGVLLTSQNASTWSPDQTKDLKFVLNRANFVTSGSVTYKSSIQGKLLSVDVTGAGTGYTTAPTVTIAPPGITATATAILSNGGVTSFTGLAGGSNYTAAPFVTIGAPDGSGNKRQAKAVAFISSAGVVYKISTATADGGDPGLGYSTAPTVTIAPPGVTATASAKLNPITNEVDQIVINIPGSNYKTPPAVTISAPTSGTTATAEAVLDSVSVNGFNLNQTVLSPIKTAVSNDVTLASNTYTGLSLLSDYKLTTTSEITISNQSTVTNTLTTSSPYVSPMIDLERKSLICYKNEINNSDADEEDGNGEAIARYITKPIALNNSSNQLNIYLDVNRPIIGSNVSVYVNFDNSPTWILCTPNSGSIPVNADSTQYSEVQYTVTDADNYFTTFAIKIVMTSSNAAYVPTVKDLRAIATI